MCHASVCNARCRFTFVPSHLDEVLPSQSSRRRWRLCRRLHRWRIGRRTSNYTWRVRRRCRRLVAAFCRSDIDALLHARHYSSEAFFFISRLCRWPMKWSTYCCGPFNHNSQSRHQTCPCSVPSPSWRVSPSSGSKSGRFPPACTPYNFASRCFGA